MRLLLGVVEGERAAPAQHRDHHGEGVGWGGRSTVSSDAGGGGAEQGRDRRAQIVGGHPGGVGQRAGSAVGARVVFMVVVCAADRCCPTVEVVRWFP